MFTTMAGSRRETDTAANALGTTLALGKAHQTPQSTLMCDAIEKLVLGKERRRENHFRHSLTKFPLPCKVQQKVRPGHQHAVIRPLGVAVCTVPFATG
jgi:hypothetical protein